MVLFGGQNQGTVDLVELVVDFAWVDSVQVVSHEDELERVQIVRYAIAELNCFHENVNMKERAMNRN